MSITFSGMLPKEKWQPMDKSKVCQYQDCGKTFGFFGSKDNCHRCGIVICSTCKSLTTIPGFFEEPKPTCPKCFEYIEKQKKKRVQQAQLQAQRSSSFIAPPPPSSSSAASSESQNNNNNHPTSTTTISQDPAAGPSTTASSTTATVPAPTALPPQPSVQSSSISQSPPSSLSSLSSPPPTSVGASPQQSMGNNVSSSSTSRNTIAPSSESAASSSQLTQQQTEVFTPRGTNITDAIDQSTTLHPSEKQHLQKLLQYHIMSTQAKQLDAQNRINALEIQQRDHIQLKENYDLATKRLQELQRANVDMTTHKQQVAKLQADLQASKAAHESSETTAKAHEDELAAHKQEVAKLQADLQAAKTEVVALRAAAQGGVESSRAEFTKALTASRQNFEREKMELLKKLMSATELAAKVARGTPSLSDGECQTDIVELEERLQSAPSVAVFDGVEDGDAAVGTSMESLEAEVEQLNKGDQGMLLADEVMQRLERERQILDQRELNVRQKESLLRSAAEKLRAEKDAVAVQLQDTAHREAALACLSERERSLERKELVVQQVYSQLHHVRGRLLGSAELENRSIIAMEEATQRLVLAGTVLAMANQLVQRKEERHQLVEDLLTREEVIRQQMQESDKRLQRWEQSRERRRLQQQQQLDGAGGGQQSPRSHTASLDRLENAIFALTGFMKSQNQS